MREIFIGWMAHFPALAHRVSWRVFSPFLMNPGCQYTYPLLLYLCMVQKKSHKELSTRAGLAVTLYRPWLSSHQYPFIAVLLFPWSCLGKVWCWVGAFSLTEPFGCSLLCACDTNHVPIEHGVVTSCQPSSCFLFWAALCGVQSSHTSPPPLSDGNLQNTAEGFQSVQDTSISHVYDLLCF